MCNLRVLLLTAFSMGFSSCQGNWQTVEIPAGIALADVLAIALYAPHDRYILLNDAGRFYGKPRDEGVENKGGEHISYEEYIGEHGRIRICTGIARSEEEGLEGSQWLELYPGKLYLEDVIRKKYLVNVTIAGGVWKLSFIASDRSCLTLDLNGKAITKIADLPRP